MVHGRTKVNRVDSEIFCNLKMRKRFLFLYTIGEEFKIYQLLGGIEKDDFFVMSQRCLLGDISFS